jgi:hypothetical protein
MTLKFSLCVPDPRADFLGNQTQTKPPNEVLLKSQVGITSFLLWQQN